MIIILHPRYELSHIILTPTTVFVFFFFFFNDTATTEIYTLSLHDALPILVLVELLSFIAERQAERTRAEEMDDVISVVLDRKSTRLNSSHPSISYAVFCLKKKKKQK